MANGTENLANGDWCSPADPVPALSSFRIRSLSCRPVPTRAPPYPIDGFHRHEIKTLTIARHQLRRPLCIARFQQQLQMPHQVHRKALRADLRSPAGARTPLLAKGCACLVNNIPAEENWISTASGILSLRRNGVFAPAVEATSRFRGNPISITRLGTVSQKEGVETAIAKTIGDESFSACWTLPTQSSSAYSQERGLRMKILSACVLFVGIAGLAAAEDLDRGIELYRKNNFTESASVLRKVVQEDEGNARANLYLGLALIEQGKGSDAAPFIGKADELSPSGETKMGKARLAIDRKDFDAAESALKDADGEDVPYVRGLLALNRKQYEDAAKELEAYSESHPAYAYAHYYAGMAYNGLRRPDKMLTHFELFLKMKPDAPEARKVNSVIRAAK